MQAHCLGILDRHVAKAANANAGQRHPLGKRDLMR
jgi:hypothetical protein